MQSEFKEMIFESVQKNELQMEKSMKINESIAKHDELSKNFFERAFKSLDDGDKRDEQLATC